MTRRDLHGMRGLVTGASSGIGRALAIELAKPASIWCCWPVAAIDWRMSSPKSQPWAVALSAVVGDVTDPDYAPTRSRQSQEKLGGLDILVNNAGTSAHGRFADADPARLRPIMETNFFAPVELIRASLPLLRQGRTPIVVNIGSVLGDARALTRASTAPANSHWPDSANHCGPSSRRVGSTCFWCRLAQPTPNSFSIYWRNTAICRGKKRRRFRPSAWPVRPSAQ